MLFNIGDYVFPANSNVKPIYRGPTNEFGEEIKNKYVPKDNIGIIKGIRKRYINTPNEYNQYYVTFLNNNISTNNGDNLYNEFDLVLLDSLKSIL